MASSNVLDSLYGKAASFGRDVFHYMVQGTVFVIGCSVPWWFNIPWQQIRESSQAAVLVVAAAGLFALGHALLGIGFWMRRKITQPNKSWWDKSWHWVFVWSFFCGDQLKKYECAIKRAREILPDALAVEDDRAEGDPANVHVGLEMSVLVKHPELHAVFLERYNTLWHLRLGLATSFLLVGVVDFVLVPVVALVLGICSLDTTSCLRNQCLPVLAGSAIGLISTWLGCFLMRQHLRTNTNFLHRVIVAFNISERTDA